MKAVVNFEVNPFSTPNFVLCKSPIEGDENISLPLSMLDSNTLDRLCEDFYCEVFKKAGKQPPPRQG